MSLKKILFTLLMTLPIIIATKLPENHHLSLRHQIFDSLSSFSSVSSVVTPSNAMSTLQTCKDVGSTWNGLTGTLDSVKGTWQGTECNTQCTAQKGIVCGNVLKDCCAMQCQGTFYKSCKFDLKLTRQMMQCGV